MKNIYVLVALFCLTASVACAAEVGRTTMRASSSPEIAYQEIMSDHTWGVEAGVNWNSVDWELGGESYSKSLLMPELTLLLAVQKKVNLVAAIASYDLNDGAQDLNMLRTGLGLRTYFSLVGDYVAMLQGTINYYGIRSDTVESIDNGYGAKVTGGVGYILNEYFTVMASAGYETFLSAPSAVSAGERTNLGMNNISAGVSLVANF